MAFGDFVGKAKDVLGQHNDKVDQAFDKLGEDAKERFAQHDEHIDGLTQRAKDYDFSEREQAAPVDPQADEPPPAG